LRPAAALSRSDARNDDVDDAGDDHVVDALALHEEADVKRTRQELEDEARIGIGRHLAAFDGGREHRTELTRRALVQRSRHLRELRLRMIEQPQPDEHLTLERASKFDESATDSKQVFA
jgi:hypothetical protein